jgi:ribosomal protein S25
MSRKEKADFAEVSSMPSAFQVRAKIAELEEEERALHAQDRHFWENPKHTTEAQTAYSHRKEQLQRIRKELQALHRDLAIESIRQKRP